MAGRSTAARDKGVSLARVPALIVGSLLLAFGLLALLENNATPTGSFPDGTVNGSNFLGFEVNGWTGLITAVAGGLLMFGAAQHLLAKTMSLVVGLALGACSVIALVDGDDVLGLAAANGPTKLGWGAASAFLLINTLLPRKGGRTRDDDVGDADRDRIVSPPPARRREVQATEVREDRRDGRIADVRDDRRDDRTADVRDDRADRLDDPRGDRLGDRTADVRDDRLGDPRGDRLDDVPGTRPGDSDSTRVAPRDDGSSADDLTRRDPRR